MFSRVHISAVSLAFCALLFTSALPQVVRSQEEEGSTIKVETGTSTSATSTDLIGVVSEKSDESLSNLYQVEGVPGGGVAIGDFVVGPGKIDLTIKPGESKIVEITVTNRTGERRRFNIESEDAQGSADPSVPLLLLGAYKGPYSMRDYVSVPYNSFEINHNERARIPVTITIPPDADPGGLYGSILVDTVAVDAKEGDTSGAVPQSAIIARIGTLFFITIPGSVEKAGNVKNFGTIAEKSFYQSGPINFGILFENTGSIHLAPYGELRITNMFDQEIGYLELEPWFVLPGSVRLREISWTREFLFGRYTATVLVNRSYDDIVDKMSFSFWVLPWKIMLGSFTVLFFVLFIIRAFFRSFEFKRK